MTWKIVVDSACDIMTLPTDDVAIAYERVPFIIQIGNEMYVDDEGLDVEQLMRAMDASDSAAASACPSPDRFLEAYKGADNVIAITITSQMSGSHNSAFLAKKMLEEDYPKTNIHLIDSLSAGGEIDLLVLELVRLIKQGLTFEEVVDKITAYQKQTKLLFALSKVDNLVKNGRLSKLVGKVVGLLNIRLVGEASPEGTLEVLEKPRGQKKALERIYQELKQHGYVGGRLVIAHQDNAKFCKQLTELIESDFPEAAISIYPTSGLCSFYAEQGGVMIGYETQKI
ncbi:DegV family protein [Streptococcus hyointestinalis]|uniref:DegV family protein n=1 Tax=Streptococcus hyointestinalis TaxID=1337 RepID=UPI003D0832D5